MSREKQDFIYKNTQITRDQNDLIARLAGEAGMSQANLIRLLLEIGLENYQTINNLGSAKIIDIAKRVQDLVSEVLGDTGEDGLPKTSK